MRGSVLKLSWNLTDSNRMEVDDKENTIVIFLKGDPFSSFNIVTNVEITGGLNP